jgi:S1-C subfamily serine protease
MKHFPMLGSLAVVLSGLLTAHSSPALGAPLNWPIGSEFLFYTSQGYLGVDLKEIDADRATALKLKDTHGAEVITVDHDAPAGKSGLKIHDVILQLDGQAFDTVDQLRRRLLDMPAGRTVSFLISRDGNQFYVSAQLCDGSILGQQAWSQHYSVPKPAPAARGVESFLGNPAPVGTAFLDSMIPKGLLYVGADVNPVRTQLADYFGVRSGTGLLVESVDTQSPAARAGLKAGDVVTKVDSQPMTSHSDWAKALRRHRGKLVQVTVMRNKQEQVLTMSAGKLKK